MSIISILIPIHNRLNTTKAGLQSLMVALDFYYNHGQGCFTYKVVVVDDGSTDGSSEWISANYPQVHLLRGDGNLWWTGAINLAAEYSINNLAVDYVLLWNDDIAPDTNFFLVAEENLLKFDSDILFGAKIVDLNDASKILSCGGFFNKFSGTETIVTDRQIAKISDKRYIPVDSLTGMGTFVSKSVINIVGYWDKKLPHYKADSDYTLMATNKGLKVLADTNLIIRDDSSKRGIPKPKDFKNFFVNLKSIRSPYNLKFLERYNRKHGIVPFSYYGVFVQILPVFLGICKRTVFGNK